MINYPGAANGILARLHGDENMAPLPFFANYFAARKKNSRCEFLLFYIRFLVTGKRSLQFKQTETRRKKYAKGFKFRLIIGGLDPKNGMCSFVSDII